MDMKRSAIVSLFLAAITTAVLTMPVSGATSELVPNTAATESSLSWSIRGFNYPSWWHDEYLSQSSSDSLSRVASTGANWVAIVPTQYMESATSDSMAPENGGEGRTASDEAVAKAIDDAHARGLKVMLKPHIDISDGTSRWDIQPTHPAQWFANYKSMMVNYASLAEAHHVELFSVGTELVSITGSNYYDYWADMIGGVRSVYGGPITYASSTTECDYLSFGGLLDYLGLDVYFPLSDNAEPTLQELISGWTDYHGYYGDANWLSSVEQCQAYWNKPVIFTELGYRSIKYVAMSPWDWSDGIYDGSNQARAYEAAFEVLGNEPWLAGVFWWDWMPGADTGGYGNTDYTIINKPAEDVVKSWYALGQAQKPAIEATVSSVGWSSYADYVARELSVDILISNNGAGIFHNVAMTGAASTNNVTLSSPMPLNLGDLASGVSVELQVRFHIPEGVGLFKTRVTGSARDANGSNYFFP